MRNAKMQFHIFKYLDINLIMFKFDLVYQLCFDYEILFPIK